MSNRFSNAYMFTIPTDEIDTSVSLQMLRREAKARNLNAALAETFDPSKDYKVRYRIQLRGRLGRNNPNAYLYAKGGKLHRQSSQDIKVEHSSRVDVYLRKVRIYA